MHSLSLRAKCFQYVRYLIALHERSRIQAFELQLPFVDRLYPLLRRGWYSLESPFFIWYPPEKLIALYGNLLLPALFCPLPACPCLRSLGKYALSNRRLLSRSQLLLYAFAVDERPSRGDGQQEEAHPVLRNDECLRETEEEWMPLWAYIQGQGFIAT